MKYMKYMKYTRIESDTINNGVTTLTRIRALVDIPERNVKAGELGGYIENELNLSHAGTCWVSDNASVSGNAYVFGNARVSGTACVSGNARVFGNARVSDDAHVSDNACVSGNAWVSGNARVFGTACVYDSAHVFGDACVSGNAWVSGNALVFDDACVYGNANVASTARIDSSDKVMWFSNVGTEHGTLTVYATETGLDCTRGCFTGTVDEFLSASAVTHADDERVRNQYRLLIDVARLTIQ